jgi:hypothetical protein
LHREFESSPKAHIVRIALTLVGIVVVGVLLRPVLLPADFGKYGHYRPGAVDDEASRLARNLSSESCFDCHPLIRKLHVNGTHKDISCEVCHGAFGDHVKDDAVYAAMPVVRGQEIRPMCLRCHTKVVQAMPPKDLKLVALPTHLEEKKVRTIHVCNQCHHVHAPLKWVHEAREMMGLPKDRGET